MEQRTYDSRFSGSGWPGWGLYFAAFSVGLDGLALVIWQSAPAAAAVAIPILIFTQLGILLLLAKSNGPISGAWDTMPTSAQRSLRHMIAIATLLPAAVSIVAWWTIAALTIPAKLH